MCQAADLLHKMLPLAWVFFLRVLDPVSILTEAYNMVVGTSYSSRGSQPEGSSRPGRGLETTICIPWLWLEAVQLWFCSKAHECGLLNQTHYNIILSEIDTYIHLLTFVYIFSQMEQKRGAHPSVYAGVVIKYMPPVMPRYIGGAV
jgi:hypothetical protein